MPGGSRSRREYYTPSIAIFALTAGVLRRRRLRRRHRPRAGRVQARARGRPADGTSSSVRGWRPTVLTAFGAVVLMFAVSGGRVRRSTSGCGCCPPRSSRSLLGGSARSRRSGFAVASFVRRADTAPIVANLTLFPLLFVSGVFFSVVRSPTGCGGSPDVFPLSHLVEAFEASSARTRPAAASPEKRPPGARRVGRRRARSSRRGGFAREATDEEGGGLGARVRRPRASSA